MNTIKPALNETPGHFPAWGEHPIAECVIVTNGNARSLSKAIGHMKSNVTHGNGFGRQGRRETRPWRCSISSRHMHLMALMALLAAFDPQPTASGRSMCSARHCQPIGGGGRGRPAAAADNGERDRGEVGKSLNGLTDRVDLSAGPGITLASQENRFHRLKKDRAAAANY